MKVSGSVPCGTGPVSCVCGNRTRKGASVKRTRSVRSERARMPTGIRSRSGFAKQMRGLPVTGSMSFRRSGAIWFPILRFHATAHATNVQQFKLESALARVSRPKIMDIKQLKLIWKAGLSIAASMRFLVSFSNWGRVESGRGTEGSECAS